MAKTKRIIKIKRNPKLTQNLSSSTLFYFTDKLDWVIDSLKNGFLCRYHFEKLPLAQSGYIAPIKCFCDTPLSLIKPHLSWYGNYGIGIDKVYGRENSITPVLYIPTDSPISDELLFLSGENKLGGNPLLPYYKRYEGEVIDKKTGKSSKRRFYDEREWRFFAEGYILDPVDSIDEKKIKTKIDKYNNSNLPRLKIELDSLEYIIVNSPRDLKKLLPALKEISKSNNVTYESLVS